MDYNNLSPDALFSPSKAAQQRAQAHDWQHVETWLSSLYPTRALPSFERNEETLKALLALASANERANEEAGLVQALEEEVHREIGEVDVNAAEVEADAELLNAIEENMPDEGRKSLSALANLSTTLDAADTDPETLAHALLAQSTHHTSLRTYQTALSTLRHLLTADLQTLRATLRAITSDPSLVVPSSLPCQTTDYHRQTKQLLPKLKEYEDRLSALPSPAISSPVTDPFAPSLARPLSRGFGSPAKSTASSEKAGAAAKQLASSTLPFSTSALEKLGRAEAEVARLRADVGRLEAQVRAYRDLPPERDEARQVVRERERVLAELRGRMDGAFEALVE